jgi:hypothetical protein
MQKMKTELDYEFFKTKIPITRHKQHFEFHYEFRFWDGCQMVNTEVLLYILVKIWIKSYHEIDTNIFCSIKSIPF